MHRQSIVLTFATASLFFVSSAPIFSERGKRKDAAEEGSSLAELTDLSLDFDIDKEDWGMLTYAKYEKELLESKTAYSTRVKNEAAVSLLDLSNSSPIPIGIREITLDNPIDSYLNNFPMPLYTKGDFKIPGYDDATYGVSEERPSKRKRTSYEFELLALSSTLRLSSSCIPRVEGEASTLPSDIRHLVCDLLRPSHEQLMLAVKDGAANGASEGTDQDQPRQWYQPSSFPIKMNPSQVYCLFKTRNVKCWEPISKSLVSDSPSIINTCRMQQSFLKDYQDQFFDEDDE
jgi:hypothetical protein